MEDNVRYHFALLFMESRVCDQEVKSAGIERSDVDMFMSQRMKFFQVRVSVLHLGFLCVVQLTHACVDNSTSWSVCLRALHDLLHKADFGQLAPP
jgi:hypothetical protein